MRRLFKTTLTDATLWVVLLLVGCETPPAIRLPTPAGAPPADEEVWAIRCLSLHGPDQFQRAEAWAAALRKVPGLKPELVQIITDEEGTTLYYGRYRRIYADDPAKERYEPNHLKDLETIRSLRFEGQDVWPFILATMDVLPTYHTSHPEWDLNNADGYWTLHVAVFYNTGGMQSRRYAAEEYCRILREQGEEAYFHHGPVRSSVYIGAFPFSAIADVQREDPLAGGIVRTITIVDPKLKAIQERFPHSLENGHRVYNITRDPQTGEVIRREPTPSFPVIMPKAKRRLEQAERP